jgi:hypothetical protein
VNQKLHEWLPQNFGCFAVRHNHVEKTVEGKERGNFRDDEQLFHRRLSAESRHTYNENNVT